MADEEQAALENIYKEFQITERTYLEHLDLVLKYFADPLLCNRIISIRDATTIFGDIRSIRLVNQVLYDRLNLDLDIVEAFGDLIHFMKLYTSYSRSYATSQQLLSNLKESNKEFRQFWEHQECLPALRGLKLSALLITPVQRIPRYRLLVEQMLRVLNEDSKQYRQVAKLRSQISRLADTVNKCVEGYENSAKILQVQKMLDSCAPKLLVPGRKLLKEGFLNKMSQKNSKFRRRMFWLFTDILLYAKCSFGRSNGPYKCSCVFPLRHCVVERVLGQSMFRIICKEDVVIMQADQYSIIDQWVFAIEAAIGQLLESRKTLRKESSSSTPLHRNELRMQRNRSTLSTKLNRKRKNTTFDSWNQTDVGNLSEGGSKRSLGSLISKLKRKLCLSHENVSAAGKLETRTARSRLPTSASLFSTESRIPLDKIAEESSSIDATVSSNS